MYTAIREKIHFKREKLKIQLTIVAKDIRYLQKYDEELANIRKLKIDVGYLEREVACLERILDTYFPNDTHDSDKFFKKIIQDKKTEFTTANEKLKLAFSCESYDKRKETLDKDLKILKKMLNIWRFTIKANELSEEQLLAFNYARGKIKI